jgi:hypothetical protein
MTWDSDQSVHTASGYAGPDAPVMLGASLEALGPVLLLSLARPQGAGWRLVTTVDALGVREYLDCGRWRAYRLPDSDFLGWERLAHLCSGGPVSPRTAIRLAPPRAQIARFAGGHWVDVSRVSVVGWEVAQSVMRLEGVPRLEFARG